MPILAHWWKFTHHMIEFEKDAPGVYELGDRNETVVYIGSSNQVKKRLIEHFHEPAGSCVRRNATLYRVEYAAEYQRREREALAEHIAAYGRPPKCNSAAESPEAPER